MKRPVLLLLLLASVPVLAADRGYYYYDRNKIYIPGFRTYVASGYVSSEPNIKLLQELKGKVPGLRLVAFDRSRNNVAKLVCRLSFPVYGPNKTPFALLLESAANMELADSEIAVPDAPRVRATLDEFDFSSVDGKWTIQATFATDGKEPLLVRHVHSYKVSAGAVAGCRDVTYELVNAIEAFLRALYSDTRFPEFMQSSP